MLSIKIPRLCKITFEGKPKTYAEKLFQMSEEARERISLTCNGGAVCCELCDIFHSTVAYLQLENGVGVTIGDVMDLLTSEEKIEFMKKDVVKKSEADWSFIAYLEDLKREKKYKLLHDLSASFGEEERKRKIPDLRF
jgi:hypothetical protein